MIAALCLAAAVLPGPGIADADPLQAGLDPTPWAIALPVLEAPQAQEDPLRASWRKHGPFSEGYYIFAGVLVRETTLWGDWYDNGLEDDDYKDIFKPGTGLVVEVGAMIPYREDWRVGLYLSGGWDTYDGDGITTSPGVTFKPDEMVVFTGLAGFRGMFHFAEIFFLEAHAAGGVVYYQDVDATEAGLDFELFESTVGGAVEVGTRFGIELVYLEVEIGVGYRYQSGPDRGDGAADEVKPGPMNCLFIEIGGALRF